MRLWPVAGRRRQPVGSWLSKIRSKGYRPPYKKRAAHGKVIVRREERKKKKRLKRIGRDIKGQPCVSKEGLGIRYATRATFQPFIFFFFNEMRFFTLVLLATFDQPFGVEDEAAIGFRTLPIPLSGSLQRSFEPSATV